MTKDHFNSATFLVSQIKSNKQSSRFTIQSEENSFQVLRHCKTE